MEQNKYSNGKIYKIISPSHPDLVYYGSTVQLLCQRMGGHRRNFNKDMGCKSKEILQYDDAQILLVQKFPCTSKEELIAKESEYIRNNQCVNKDIPGRTFKEYYEDNKEKIQNYREKNKEKIQQQRSTIVKCECGAQVSIANLSTHRKSEKHALLMTQK